MKIISIDGSSVSGETDFYSIFLGLTSVMATDTMIYSWVGSTALPLVAKNHSLHLYLIGGFNPSGKNPLMVDHGVVFTIRNSARSCMPDALLMIGAYYSFKSYKIQLLVDSWYLLISQLVRHMNRGSY